MHKLFSDLNFSQIAKSTITRFGLFILLACILVNCSNLNNSLADNCTRNQNLTIVIDSNAITAKESIEESLADSIYYNLKIIDVVLDSSQYELQFVNTQGVSSEMPIANYNGRYVIVNTDIYSCCMDMGNFLYLYDMQRNMIKIEIQTSPDEYAEWNEANFDSVRMNVKELLKARSYYSMNHLYKDSYKIIRSDATSDMHIEFIYSNKKNISKSFKFDSIEYEDSYCCMAGDPIDKSNCKIYPEIMDLWIVASEKIVLLEYGVIHGTDGCDRGPFYKAVELEGKD